MNWLRLILTVGLLVLPNLTGVIASQNAYKASGPIVCEKFSLGEALGVEPSTLRHGGVDYEIVRLLGEGTFGRAYLLREPGENGRLVVAKELKQTKQKKTEPRGFASDITGEPRSILIEDASDSQKPSSPQALSQAKTAQQKVQLENKSEPPSIFDRFDFEHQSLIALQHAHETLPEQQEEPRRIPAAYGSIEVNESGYSVFLMEYVKGATTLSDWVTTKKQSGKKVSDQEIAKIGYEVAKALSLVHRSGLVHRDIKPDNIILTLKNDGSIDRVLVIDLGLAADKKLIQREKHPVGTPLYMGPAAWLSSPHFSELQHSDLFSLGVLLYELKTGERPFHAVSTGELAARIVSLSRNDGNKPRPNSKTPKEWVEFLDHFWDFSERRWRSADEVARAVERLAPDPEKFVQLENDQYKILKEVGVGSFGRTFLVEGSTGKKAIAKALREKELKQKDEDRKLASLSALKEKQSLELAKQLDRFETKRFGFFGHYTKTKTRIKQWFEKRRATKQAEEEVRILELARNSAFEREAKNLDFLTEEWVVSGNKRSLPPFPRSFGRFGKTNLGGPTILMENIEGGITLEQWQQKRRQENRPIKDQDIAKIGIEISRGLQFMHKHGIYHRDIKPQNILVTTHADGSIDRVVIVDFGLSVTKEQLLEEDQDSIVGTPEYLSPESWQPPEGQPIENLTAQRDLFALGVLLFQLKGGDTPFRASEAEIEALLKKHGSKVDHDRAKAAIRLIGRKILSLTGPDPKLPLLPEPDRKWQNLFLQFFQPEVKDRFANPQAVIKSLQQLVPSEARAFH
ncbi:MAG: protein kinase [Bacteriovoracia bacterium]